MELDLEQARRRAKELLRAARAGDAAALALLRPDRTPRLADAQRAVAQDLGFASWPALLGHVDATHGEVAVVLEAASPLAAARAGWGERGEVEVVTHVSYAPGRPVRVRVRKRGRRYELDDVGVAVTAAGRPQGWMAVAERVVAEEGLNVNRPGRVFVAVVEGRDLDALVRKVAETSLAVHAALLELDG